MNDEYKQYESKMQNTIDALAKNYAAIRAGKANPAVLNKIHIEYYGCATPVNQVATISSPDARTLMIQPFDPSVLKEIEKGILASDIGITPQNDGRVIRLVFPPLTEERRREIVKGIAKTAEEAKVAVRNIRRDAIDKFKAMKKKSEMTEDDVKSAEKDIQNLTDKYCGEIDSLTENKQKEIMEL